MLSLFFMFLCFRHQLPDYEPMAVKNQTFQQWYNKSLDHCILSDDRECNMRDGDIVDNQMVCINNLTKKLIL